MTANSPPVLTVRQSEILGLIGSGHSNLEIQEKLYLSANTIKTHIRRIYAQIGVRNRAQAVAWAYSHGLGAGAELPIEPPDPAPARLHLVRA